MVSVEPFGTSLSGEPVHRYTLSAENVTVRVMDFGATVLGIDVPDTQGNVADVVLGFDDLEGYFDDPALFGATVGPIANRTTDAELTIDGATWKLVKNNGTSNIHTDTDHALQKRVWNAEVDEATNAVTMTCEMAHGELGLPGNRTFTATFSLAEDGTFTIAYGATTDQATYAALTNHMYFNLAGHANGDVRGQLLTVCAEHYLPITSDTFPTGEIAPVANTVLDFRQPKAIGTDLDDEAISGSQGYDHCFCIDGYKGADQLRPAAALEDPASGRRLQITITAPGLQVYTGGWLGDRNAKDGVDYGHASGVALEPEMYPDTMHHPNFPQRLTTPGQPYRSVLQYRFSTH